MNTRLVCASHSPLMYCFKKEPKDWGVLQQTIAAEAEMIRSFNPEVVIAFGSDHFNGFFLKLMPAFCVGFAAEAVGDIGGFPGRLNVPADIAKALVTELRRRDLDPAVSYRMRVDHALSQTLHLMLGGIAARPVIPIFINCITTPFVPFRRSRMLGEAVSRFAASLDKRVLFLASGGMSHHPTRYYPALGEGTEEVESWQISGGDDPRSLTGEQWLERLYVMHHEGAEMIARGERTAAHMRLNEEVDRRFLSIQCENRIEAFDDWDQEEMVNRAGIGSMELHTWIAAAAAHRAAGGNVPQTRFYSVAPEIGIAAGIVSAD